MAGDISEDKDNVTTELDQVIPKHQLLDSTAAKHKKELAHRGILASRHRPSGQGLRTQILRRQQEYSKEASPNGSVENVQISDTPSIPKEILGKPKLGASFLSDIQAAQKGKCKHDSAAEDNEKVESQVETNGKLSELSKDDENSGECSISKNSKPAFLSEIANLTSTKGKLNKKIKPKQSTNPPLLDKSDVQEQLRRKLESRKKLVDASDEGTENAITS